MRDKDMTAAEEALCRWFESQRILPRDAIEVMCRVITRCIYSLSKGPDDMAEGMEAAAEMLRDMRVQKKQ